MHHTTTSQPRSRAAMRKTTVIEMVQKAPDFFSDDGDVVSYEAVTREISHRRHTTDHQQKRSVQPSNTKHPIGTNNDITSEAWRKYGLQRRHTILADDKEVGGLDFHLNRLCPIERYCQLNDKVWTRRCNNVFCLGAHFERTFANNPCCFTLPSVNHNGHKVLQQFREMCNDIKNHNVEELYVMGNRLLTFLSLVLPHHPEYVGGAGPPSPPRSKLPPLTWKERCQRDVAWLSYQMQELELLIDEQQLQLFITNDYEPAVDENVDESDGSESDESHDDDDDSFSDLASMRSNEPFVPGNSTTGWADFDDGLKTMSLRLPMASSNTTGDSVATLSITSASSASSSSSSHETCPAVISNTVMSNSAVATKAFTVVKRIAAIPFTKRDQQNSETTSSIQVLPIGSDPVEQFSDPVLEYMSDEDDDSEDDLDEGEGQTSAAAHPSSLQVVERVEYSNGRAGNANDVEEQARPFLTRRPPSILRSLENEAVCYESDSEAVDSWAQSEGVTNRSPSIATSSSGTGLTCDPARIAFRDIMNRQLQLQREQHGQTLELQVSNQGASITTFSLSSPRRYTKYPRRINLNLKIR
jgi:hypothetical protein